MDRGYKDFLESPAYEEYKRLCHLRWALGPYRDYPQVQIERDDITRRIEEIEVRVAIKKVKDA